MLKLDDADPIVIKAKKAMVEYKNENITMFYLAKKIQLESYTDTAKISNRIIKVYRFVIGAHKRNLGQGDFVIVEEFAWAPNRGLRPRECVSDKLMTRKEARREWKKRLAWTPPDGRPGSCVQLSAPLVPNWVKPFNEEQPAF